MERLWYWRRNGQIEQWDSTERPETQPHTRCPRHKATRVFNKWAGTTARPHAKSDSRHRPHALDDALTVDHRLHAECETIKLGKDNTGEILGDPAEGVTFHTQQQRHNPRKRGRMSRLC